MAHVMRHEHEVTRSGNVIERRYILNALWRTFFIRRIEIMRRAQKIATIALTVASRANCMCNTSSDGLALATSQ